MGTNTFLFFKKMASCKFHTEHRNHEVRDCVYVCDISGQLEFQIIIDVSIKVYWNEEKSGRTAQACLSLGILVVNSTLQRGIINFEIQTSDQKNE